MKLQTTTDYGIRVMMCLYNKDALTTASELAKEVGASYSYLNKVFRCLRNAGMIEAVQGGQGGYRIAESARTVTLYEIIKAMQGEIHLNHCLEEDHYCSRNIQEFCSVRAVLEAAEENLILELSSVHLSELSNTRRVGYGRTEGIEFGKGDTSETIPKSCWI